MTKNRELLHIADFESTDGERRLTRPALQGAAEAARRLTASD
jgi:hypothetical protein